MAKKKSREARTRPFASSDDLMARDVFLERFRTRAKSAPVGLAVEGIIAIINAIGGVITNCYRQRQGLDPLEVRESVESNLSRRPKGFVSEGGRAIRSRAKRKGRALARAARQPYDAGRWDLSVAESEEIFRVWAAESQECSDEELASVVRGLEVNAV